MSFHHFIDIVSAHIIFLEVFLKVDKNDKKRNGIANIVKKTCNIRQRDSNSLYKSEVDEQPDAKRTIFNNWNL